MFRFRLWGRCTPRFLLVCLMMVLALPARAQNPATITFTLDFPGSEPDHYAISIASDGHGSYDSTGKLRSDVQDQDAFHLDFTVSQATRNRVFELARRAHFFQGNIDSGKKNLASTGKKVLSYQDVQHSTEARYNYSSLPAVQQLTQMLQSLSTTLEFGRRLQYYHRYQKLGLDEELKRMEEMAKDNGLVEISAIASVLEQIAADSSVINADRARAQRLLALAQNGQ